MFMSAQLLPCESVVVFVLNENDVLFGRGVSIANNIGNIRFRQLVRSRQAAYMKVWRHQIKHNMAQKIYQEICRRNGRFLRRIQTVAEHDHYGVTLGTQAWVVASEDAAIEKIKQTLRDKSSMISTTFVTGDGGDVGRVDNTPPMRVTGDSNHVNEGAVVGHVRGSADVGGESGYHIGQPLISNVAVGNGLLSTPHQQQSPHFPVSATGDDTQAALPRTNMAMYPTVSEQQQEPQQVDETYHIATWVRNESDTSFNPPQQHQQVQVRHGYPGTDTALNWYSMQQLHHHQQQPVGQTQAVIGDVTLASFHRSELPDQHEALPEMVFTQHQPLQRRPLGFSESGVDGASRFHDNGLPGHDGNTSVLLVPGQPNVPADGNATLASIHSDCLQGTGGVTSAFAYMQDHQRAGQTHFPVSLVEDATLAPIRRKAPSGTDLSMSACSWQHRPLHLPRNVSMANHEHHQQQGMIHRQQLGIQQHCLLHQQSLLMVNVAPPDPSTDRSTDYTSSSFHDNVSNIVNNASASPLPHGNLWNAIEHSPSTLNMM